MRGGKQHVFKIDILQRKLRLTVEGNKMVSDRRVMYTKMVLKNSLIGLLKEKPLSRITITEICEKADVHRATFYSHYDNQYDQLNHLEIKFFNDIISYLDQMEFGCEPLKVIERLLDHILENREFCCILLGSHGDSFFEEKLAEILRKNVFSLWKVDKSDPYSIQEYIYSYAISGCIGIMKKWLTDDKSRYTSQFMATLITRLFDEGANSSLKISI